MKRSGKPKIRSLMVILVAVVLFLAVGTLSWVVSPLAARVAMLSAALSMPEGSLSVLRERYADLMREQAPLAVPPVSAAPPSSSASLSSAASVVSSSSQADFALPDIPEQYRGAVLEESFAGYEDGPFFQWKNMWLRNYTDCTNADLTAILETPMKMKLTNTDEPQVLIYHTHATESYNPYDSAVYDRRYNWRSTDNNNNMVAVGSVLVDTLRHEGVGVIHDTSQHDYPSYDGSYHNSYDAVVRYLKEYPTIKVVLDLHRDAIERDHHLIVKPTIVLNGEKYAQVMIISNWDDGSGLIPKWRENLRFAAALADQLESTHPGLTRPILFSPRKYNQELSTGALLLEFGSHASTLEEAQRTARLVGKGLAKTLRATM
ncbi:MAG: stage II sporulation protein P [Oscillospiraceae bacterium]